MYMICNNAVNYTWSSGLLPRYFQVGLKKLASRRCGFVRNSGAPSTQSLWRRLTKWIWPKSSGLKFHLGSWYHEPRNFSRIEEGFEEVRVLCCGLRACMSKSLMCLRASVPLDHIFLLFNLEKVERLLYSLAQWPCSYSFVFSLHAQR